MKKLLAILFLLPACVTQPLSVDSIYRKDLMIKHGKMQYSGVAVLEKDYRYDLTFVFPKKPSKVVISTCHRYEVFENPGSALKYTYFPEKGIEQDELCLFEIGAFDANGQHAWGMIDFKSPTETMLGALSCNGVGVAPFEGVSVCQSKAKLIQGISFFEPVKSAASEGCPAPQTADGKSFIIETSRGKCLYVFKGGEALHRLIMFGYDDVIIRG